MKIRFNNLQDKIKAVEIVKQSGVQNMSFYIWKWIILSIVNIFVKKENV